MHIFILGSGAREHCLAYYISKSPMVTQLSVWPGNAGTNNWNIPKPESIEVLDWIVSLHVDFVLLGSEDGLVKGYVDYLLKEGVLVLGPNQSGARLEGSKAFAKTFMERHQIPTATSKVFTRQERLEAEAYIEQHPLPIVIKADGLAAGKGVTVAMEREDARQALRQLWEGNVFGASGDQVVVEEFLKGREVSVFVLTDGKRYCVLPEAMDYKRVGENQQGPNTGGMGAISPVPFFTENVKKYIINKVIEPTILGLQKDGIDYRGFIFIGLMVDGDQASVVEYNVRMGDPETQVVFPRIGEDCLPMLLEAAKGELTKTEIQVKPNCAITTVVASAGYPGAYKSGLEIEWPNDMPAGVQVFCSGVTQKGDQKVTSGGRVVSVTAIGKTLEEASILSQETAKKFKFEGAFYRKDIGKIYGD
jgi:phosphoribosylamine--glycine ligase